MSSITDHPYNRLKKPANAPFRLGPSSAGKGWRMFTTKLIKSGDVIIKEKPLFLVPSVDGKAKAKDINAAFHRLTAKQKKQARLLRQNGDELVQFPTAAEAVKENHIVMFSNATGQQLGVYAMILRCNHSCVPNTYLQAAPQYAQQLVATKDIAPGEEITRAYQPRDFMECRTRQECHEALGFVCDCKACELGTDFQRLSDARRRLLRALGKERPG